MLAFKSPLITELEDYIAWASERVLSDLGMEILQQLGNQAATYYGFGGPGIQNSVGTMRSEQ